MADLAAPDAEHGQELDVADPNAWLVLRAWLRAQVGRVDGLINNAGTTSRVRLPDVDIVAAQPVLRRAARG